MAVLARRGEWVTCHKGHDIACLADDMPDGSDPVLVMWQQPNDNVCQVCRGPWKEEHPILGLIWHIEANWRCRPTAAPERKEFATLAEMVENDPGVGGGISIEEARRMDVEIVAAFAAAFRPPWWRRLWDRIKAWLS